MYELNFGINVKKCKMTANMECKAEDFKLPISAVSLLRELSSLNQLLKTLSSCSANEEYERREPKSPKLVISTEEKPGNEAEAKDELLGIKVEEFESDPFIRVALLRVMKVLTEVYFKHMVAECEVKIDRNDEERMISASEELSLLSTYTWERLNTGHWKSVPRLWRKLYTCLAILKVSFMVLRGLPDLEIIHECDMGLLMGEPICENVLGKIAEELSSKIVADRSRSRKSELKLSDACNNKKTDRKDTVLRNKTSNEFPIEITDKPSLQRFLSLMNTETPALLLNTVDHWPAVDKWNVDYIERVAGFRTVPVEVGQKYTSEDWTQKIMTVEEFITKYIHQDCKTTGESASANQIAYIAQYNLFHQISQLGKDIRTPDYCSLGSNEDISNVDINAWFGPANTISPTHYDPKHNILVQVFGQKIIRLFPPSESNKLCPHAENSILFNTSQLDIEQEDLFRSHPEAKTLKHSDVILNPTEALYIPPKWWHYVKSLSPSFSVSFWFE